MASARKHAKAVLVRRTAVGPPNPDLFPQTAGLRNLAGAEMCAGESGDSRAAPPAGFFPVPGMVVARDFI